MVKLTKAIIKKYGITKKAWAVAKGKGKSKSKKGINKGSAAKAPRSKTMKGGRQKVITNAYVRGAAIDLIGDMAAPRANIDSRLLKSGMAYYTKDGVLVGANMANYLKGGIPAVSGALGEVGEWL